MHKRFRVVIDIDVTMLDLTVERIRETRRQMAQARRVEWPATSFADEINETLSFSVPTEEDLQPQRQLVELLLATPDALDSFLKREVVREIESGVFADTTFEVSDESLLQPLINRLPQPSVSIFNTPCPATNFMTAWRTCMMPFRPRSSRSRWPRYE